ncbi:UNC-50 family-domain-containing protein [Limtongia smithiae]|uniref:UNC-50 family-domain-containing protein n=1 Tax=Limtongia smithiae TaxID=1125753 RepID=UPI0034CFD647
MSLASIRRTLSPLHDSGPGMSILPVTENSENDFTSPPSPTSSIPSSRRRQRFNQSASISYTNWSLARIPIVLRRLLKPPTLDFETAIWEICYLFISPKKVYRQMYYRTKDTWARDDPSFVLVLSGFLILSAIAWGVAYSPGFFPIVRLMFDMVLVDFLLVGSVLATLSWFCVNRFLRQRMGRGVMSMTQQDTNIEWAYCFDVHCNSFLIIWFCLYVLQFVMLPIILKNNWFSLFLGNSLYLGAFTYYVIITYLGFSSLPLIEHTEYILFPIPVVFVLYLVSLFGFNISAHAIKFYFG